MDEIFHGVSGFKGAWDVVQVSKKKPRRYGKNGELLINYADTEAAHEAERRRSSILPSGGKIGGDVEHEEEKSNGSG